LLMTNKLSEVHRHCSDNHLKFLEVLVRNSYTCTTSFLILAFVKYTDILQQPLVQPECTEAIPITQ